MAVTKYKWSLADWHQLIEVGVFDGQSVELLEGEIFQMSPEGIPHSFTNRRVADYLRELFKGIAYVCERYPITLNNSEPQPDVSVVRLPETIYRQHHPYSDDIYFLIEISNSTLQFDLETKAKIYSRNNISEYWVVDLVNQKLVVHTLPDGDRYSQIVEYQSGSVSPQAFSDIVIPLTELF